MFLFGIKEGRELAIDNILLCGFIKMGGYVKLQFVAQRDGCRHPDLAQFIVTMPLKAIVKLLAMLFQVIGQAEPFDGQEEHPIHGLLQKFVAALRLVDFTGVLLAVTQVKRLFFVYFDERTFPGTEA